MTGPPGDVDASRGRVEREASSVASTESSRDTASMIGGAFAVLRPRRRRRTLWLRECRERLRAARSYAPQRQPDDVASVIEPLDRVHEVAHQKQAAAVLTVKVLGIVGSIVRVVEVEAGAFVGHFDDQTLAIDLGADVHVLVRDPRGCRGGSRSRALR